LIDAGVTTALANHFNRTEDQITVTVERPADTAVVEENLTSMARRLYGSGYELWHIDYIVDTGSTSLDAITQAVADLEGEAFLQVLDDALMALTITGAQIVEIGVPTVTKVEPEPPKPLTQEEINAIAVQGLKEALKMAIDYGVEKASDVALWAQDKYRIKTPMQDNFESKLAECKATAKEKDIIMVTAMVVKVCEGIEGELKEVSGMFGDAAMTLVKHPGYKSFYTRIVNELSVSEAIKVCRQGGTSACTEYLEKQANDKIIQGATRVCKESLEQHNLPKAWKKFTESWNGLAEKATKVGITLETVDFDLNEYVAKETLNHFKTLMMEKEQEIRKAPGAAVSDAVRQVFGESKPEEWKRQ